MLAIYKSAAFGDDAARNPICGNVVWESMQHSPGETRMLAIYKSSAFGDGAAMEPAVGHKWFRQARDREERGREG